MKPSTSLSQRRQILNLLHDVIYSRDFFFKFLQKAVKSDFIQSLQWSADGRFLYVDKTQALVEFENFCNVIPTLCLQYYNRLISRLLEHNFCLTSRRTAGVLNQVAYYFHPNFNKTSCDVNSVCPQSMFWNSSFNQNFFPVESLLRLQQPLPRQYLTPLEPCWSVNPGIASNLQKFGNKQSKNIPTLSTGSIAAWHGVKVVPLSFFSEALPPPELVSDNSEPTTDSTEDEISEVDEDETDEEEDQTKTTDEVVHEETKDAQPPTHLLASQKRIFDLFFNPRRRKRRFAPEWIDRFSQKDTRVTDHWKSAVLMPTAQKRKNKCTKLKMRKESFLDKNSHLVDAFGNAYVNWRQHQEKTDVETNDETSGLLRFNYSSLYDDNTSTNILLASREKSQIENAVQTIL